MSDDIASLVIEVKSEGVDKAKKSLADLSNQGAKTEQSVNKLGKESKKAADDVSGIARGSDKATSSLSSLASGAKGAALGFAAVGAGVIALGASLTKTFIDFEKLNNTLKFSTGSAALAAKEMAYIKSTVNSLGLELLSTATAYTKFSAATKGTALEGQKTRDVFEAVAKASTVMGLSADESAGALLAISQMMSKGTVSAEELRGQLGERLPGAFQIAAKSIGVTTQELGKMLEQGQIVASDFLPKFAEELTKSLGDSPQSAAGSAQAQLNKLSNEWLDFKKNIAESGVVTIVLNVVEGTNNALKVFNEFVFGSDESRARENKKKIDSINQYIERNQNSQSQKIQSYIAAAKAEKRKLERELGIFDENKLKPASGSTDNAQLSPNFSVKTKDGEGGYGTDVQVLNRLREQQQRELSQKLKAAQTEKEKRTKAYQDMLDGFKQMDDKFDKITLNAENRLRDEIKKRQIDDYKNQLEQVNNLEKIANENFANAQKEYIDAEKDRVRAFEQSAYDIKKIFLEGFAAMINGGKSSWKAFTQNLYTNFKTAVADRIYELLAKPFVVKILASLTGLTASGAAGAVDIFGTNGIGGNSSIFGTISEGLKSLNSNVVGSIEQLGVFLSNGNGGLADTIGGYLGQYATQIASALTFAPSVLSLLKGDIKSAAFQGGGAAIGLALGGPIGGAIGSFLGGAVGGLFGGKKIPRYSSQSETVYANGEFKTVSGTPAYKSLGATGATTDLNVAFTNMLIPLFESFDVDDIIGTKTRLVQKRKSSYAEFWATIDGKAAGAQGVKGSAKSTSATFQQLVDKVLGAGIANAIQSSSLVEGIKKLFIGLTDKNQVANMIGASIALNDAQKQLADRFGLTVDQAGKVSVATGLAGDELAKFATTLAQSASAFKTVGDVLVEAKAQLSEGLGGNVPASLKDFDNVLKSIDKTTQAGIDSFVAMFSLREQFVAFTSSLNQLKGGVNTALLGIVSDSEKQAMLNADLETIFAELGRDVPGSVQDLIALGKSIDFTSKEGLDLAAVFPSLVTAFVNTKGAVDDLMNSLRDVDNFKTIVDFNRYKGLAQNYGTSFANQYTDGQQVTYGTSNNTSVSIPQITASNNTTISTSDPNLLQAIQTLSAKFDALQLEASKTAIQSKRAADVLVNVSPNGNAIQTEAVV